MAAYTIHIKNNPGGEDGFITLNIDGEFSIPGDDVVIAMAHGIVSEVTSVSVEGASSSATVVTPLTL